MDRIQKVLAHAGVSSRRAIEAMILEGRVEVNGQIVAKLPCFVDTETDDVRVDGRKIRVAGGGESKRYILVNKPRGVVCTQRDPEGRPRAIDLLPPTRERLYCVGRLDVEDTGLVLLTNDGELTQRLTHPRHEVIKTYVAEVAGSIAQEQIDMIKAGVRIEGMRTNVAGVKCLSRGPTQSLVELRLAEGRNREVRRILAKLGHKVRRVRRTAIGPVTDKGLKIGGYRTLTKDEVALLRRIGR
ncbi:MAG: pseudouridine synthase [Planctomycetota bacterium]|nr:pseudouridine synthase [Planctomycetota bacterium]